MQGFSYESAWKYYLSPQKRWYSAAEQQSPVLLTDPDFQTSCLLALPFPARWSIGGDANVQLIYLPSCVFLWTPQQRLRVQPDLFCCTQNLPQFPLWRTDGPAGHSWLSLDDAVLFRGKNPRASYRLSPDDAAASCTAELFHDRLLWCALLHK